MPDKAERGGKGWGGMRGLVLELLLGAEGGGWGLEEAEGGIDI